MRRCASMLVFSAIAVGAVSLAGHASAQASLKAQLVSRPPQTGRPLGSVEPPEASLVSSFGTYTVDEGKKLSRSNGRPTPSPT